MLTRSLLAALALTLSIFALGCPPSRYASCNTDDECTGRLADGGKLVCFNMRCVECHYDSDCGDGRHCGVGNTCEMLDSRTPEADPGPPPATLEECAKRCKGNPVCGDSCRDRFKEAAPKK